MSFLDAMSCGMIPIGFDKPTYNEYINFSNGVLYNDKEYLINNRKLILALDLESNINKDIKNGHISYLNNILNIWDSIVKIHIEKKSNISPKLSKILDYIRKNYKNSDDCFDAMDL
jgi:hypothetical protein